MPTIQSLSQDVERLEKSVSLWNNWYMGMGAAAIMFGVLAFAFQYWSGHQSALLNEAQKKLRRVVEDDKDFKIGEAMKTAGEADKQAGFANERASGLEKEAAELRKQNIETATRLAEAQKASAEAQLALQKELAKRGPRATLISDSKAQLLESLRPFAGQIVEVRISQAVFGFEMLMRPEPMELGHALIGLFRESGWNLSTEATPMSALQGPPGISIQRSVHASESTAKAAEALANSLRAASLDVQGPFESELNGMPRMGNLRIFTPDVPGGPATEKQLPPQTDETIVVVVLAHP